MKPKIDVPVRTGNLRDSITHIVDTNELIASIYVDRDKAPYGKYVEFGTIHMSPNPFLHLALWENENTITIIMNS